MGLLPQPQRQCRGLCGGYSTVFPAFRAANLAPGMQHSKQAHTEPIRLRTWLSLLSLSFILCASSMMMYFHSSLLSLFLQGGSTR